jgi:plasmid stability protein
MVSITIRDVPQRTRDELSARAARSGRSLQEYLRGELIALAERPDQDLLLDRIRERVELTDTRVALEEIVDAGHADRR